VKSKLKVLILDIETTPIEAYVWGLYDQNISPEQIKKDWSVLSWSAKWLDDSPKNIMYADTRNKKDPRDDKDILKKMWKLLDKADVILTQNGKRFDQKKLFSRFVQLGFPPPSSFRHIDTLAINRKHFAHTSNKLGYVCKILNTTHKKLTHKKFPGFSLWIACLDKNKEAFKEMELYNKFDVLSLEDMYKKVAPWDNTINLVEYNANGARVCTCGNTTFLKRGFRYTNTGKFQRYRCNKCGKEMTDGQNLVKDGKKTLR
jgi:hypothetical protein